MAVDGEETSCEEGIGSSLLLRWFIPYPSTGHRKSSLALDLCRTFRICPLVFPDKMFPHISGRMSGTWATWCTFRYTYLPVPSVGSVQLECVATSCGADCGNRMNEDHCYPLEVCLKLVRQVLRPSSCCHLLGEEFYLLSILAPLSGSD